MQRCYKVLCVLRWITCSEVVGKREKMLDKQPTGSGKWSQVWCCGTCIASTVQVQVPVLVTRRVWTSGVGR
jgi:hypothetical protein